ncbi:uncharacterized protein LOC123658039 [Melitaea cinxia]|uniref:uncharacterized protein LOC123658039 n=1 Tax=Melitaea cinxia TaxID=113334 RepID=UPI001E2734BD|nr:uncharacterized protein LOC123658039 [Melitaea cinxia]
MFSFTASCSSLTSEELTRILTRNVWYCFFKVKITFLIFLQITCYAVQIEAVTVNPLCPTNKIAPHRRVARFGYSQPRTFGEFYNLLKPNNSPSSLQEKPQEDNSDDCGDIEDYDENDLSSVMPYSLRRKGYKNNRFYGSNHFFDQLLDFNQNTHRPALPPQRPTRPPVGGYFGGNAYRPPAVQEPTDHLKPVHEGGYEPHMTYRPGIVGVPIGHVIGLPQVKPTRHHLETTTNKKPYNPNHNQVHTSTQSNAITYKPHRPRNVDGILGSFIDLFL